MTKMFTKFLNRLQKSRFMAKANFFRGGRRGNVGPTMVVSKVDLVSSLTDHLAATKIQLAYRRHLSIRNTKSSSCRTNPGIVIIDCNKHGTTVETVASRVNPSNYASPISTMNSIRDHLARTTTILRSSIARLRKCHIYILRWVQAMFRMKPSPKGTHGGSEVKSKSNKSLVVESWKLHLEPKSRNRTLQRDMEHDSILDCYRLWSSECNTSRRKSDDGVASLVPIYLNVYDLTVLNSCLYWLGLGAHHSGIQVNGFEYAFGCDEDGISGLFKTEPKDWEYLTIRKSILIGWTRLNAFEIRKAINDLSIQYSRVGYHLIGNNCNHFSAEVCLKLTGNPIPLWVNRLARIGSYVVGSTSLGTKKICDYSENKRSLEKYFGDSNQPMCSSNSSASAPSIVPTVTRGKSSRWKKSVTPSSHLRLLIC